MSKICSKCKVEKDLESFYKRKEGQLGRRSECIDCRNKYFATRKDIDDARKKEYRENNRERQREWSRNWHQNNKERKVAIAKEWRKNNPEAAKAIYTRANKNKSKEQIRQANLDRRARLKSLINTMPKNWWTEMLDFYGPFCQNQECTKEINDLNPLSHDHIIPASWDTSSHSLINSQILCMSCNASKSCFSDKDYRDWSQGILLDDLTIIFEPPGIV